MNENDGRDWDAEFIKLAEGLFDDAFRVGAATLLASYDADRGLASAEGAN